MVWGPRLGAVADAHAEEQRRDSVRQHRLAGGRRGGLLVFAQAGSEQEWGAARQRRLCAARPPTPPSTLPYPSQCGIYIISIMMYAEALAVGLGLARCASRFCFCCEVRSSWTRGWGHARAV
eukprot:scaffold4344_cov114-Isochrysis_galbana.AAC.7